ncbi:MAG: EAL domain-containing protein [Magnetococcales bacterium]|nr:EAL domain-containing protein [Magnetococcales bacterium]
MTNRPKPLSGSRILIVDDEFAERLPMRATLEGEGFEIEEVENGQQALDILEKEHFDGIVLDVVMPGMNGFEVCQRIRRLATCRLLPILMVTGLDDHGSINQAYQAGATDFLTKPVNWDLVGHRVRYLLRSSRAARELDDSRRDLEEKQKLIDSFVENSPSAISIKGLDRVYQMVNPEFERSCVKSVASVPGSVDGELFHAEYAEIIQKNDQTVLEKESPMRFEEFCRKGGCDKIQLSVRFPIVGSNGQPTGIGCISTDITELKRARESLLLARNVIESTHEAIVITDENANVLDVNSAFVTMHGYSREEVLGKNPKMLQSGRHDETFFQEMWQGLAKEGLWSGEVWDRRKNGEIFPKQLTISSVANRQGQIQYYVGISRDITRQKATEEKLHQLAFYDPLTNLPNRTLFRDRLMHEIDLAARRGDEFAVLFIDLDRFKNVNDSLGHEVGDELLVQVAQRIQSCLRKSDTVARIGGDEFTVILATEMGSHGYGQVADKIIQKLREPFMLRDRQFFIGASIGIVLFPGDADSFELLTRHADTAMYRAKASGGGNYRYFSPEMDAENMFRLSLEEELHQALEKNQLALHYQPKIDLASNRVAGVEALVRWQHPERGMISPADFIPLAEETGLIVPMGIWVLKTACQQAKAWIDQGFENIRVAVNLSGRQFQDPELLAKIRNLLEIHQLPPGAIELEVTESVAMDDVEKTVAILDDFRKLGLHISVDDFGTGYSSLSYLKRLPLDSLKVDQSFVRDLTRNSDDAAIVDSIISLARAMDLKVVAEGVETALQLEFLREKLCSEIQGFYFSRPLPAQDVSLLFDQLFDSGS